MPVLEGGGTLAATGPCQSAGRRGTLAATGLCQFQERRLEKRFPRGLVPTRAGYLTEPHSPEPKRLLEPKGLRVTACQCAFLRICHTTPKIRFRLAEFILLPTAVLPLSASVSLFLTLPLLAAQSAELWERYLGRLEVPLLDGMKLTS